MTKRTIRILGAPARPLTGTARVPGDKSISHRAVILASLAEGVSHVEGFLDGGDCNATCDVLSQLDVSVLAPSPELRVVHGQGLNGWAEPLEALDCRNSGTTLRLMAGLLAGQAFTSVLVGTPQLLRRPMARITTPLRAAGAQILGRSDARFAPLALGPAALKGLTHELSVASAQVKSCLLLAGLYAEGPTTVIEPGPCRDHTERLLRAQGVELEIDGPRMVLTPPAKLAPFDVRVPGDMSSAAFVLAAGAIRPGSELLLPGVGVNPTRTGFLEALREMGAEITCQGEHEEVGEPVADLCLVQQALKGTRVDGARVVTLIDEFPVLAAVATQAEGDTVFADAAELRVKETDRIETTAQELRKLGAEIETRPDGMLVRGHCALRGAEVDSHGDHRLAMALAVAALAAEGETRIENAEVTDDSFPGFVEILAALGAEIEVLPC